MAKCQYCNKSAGFLKRKHKKCSFLHKLNKHKINSIIASAFFNKENIEDLKSDIMLLAKEGYVSDKDLNAIYLYNYDAAVKKFLYDGIITSQEEEKIIQFRETFNLDQDLLDQNGFFDKFLKSIVVRDLAESKKSSVLFDTDANLPFALEKDEYIVRVFDDINLYRKNRKIISKDKALRSSSDIEEEMFFDSIFSKNLIKKNKTKLVDIGNLVITNQSAYFLSSLGTFKIDIENFSKLIPYKDGISFKVKENKMPFEVVGNLDGWFAYNVLFNLIR